MAKSCIGIDLGGTFIKFVVVDENRAPGEVTQLPTPQEGAEALVAQMAEGAKQAMSVAGLKTKEIVGVGIGSPGPIDIAEGIVKDTPNLAGLKNCPLRDMVSDSLGLPATLENDANAAAFGEYIAGAGKDAGDIVMLTLGTGVGGGVIIDGRIVHGRHDAGAELGHIIVVPEGEECGCGQRGCLEQYASATFLARRTARRLENEGIESALRAVLSDRGELTAKDICDAAFEGDELAAEMWNEAIYYLAQACVSYCRIFDPDRIVLAGGMTKAGEKLMRPLLAHFEHLDWKLMDTPTELAIASLGSDAGSIGAAGVAWQTFGEG